jgi:hypothetical protein
MGLCLFWKPFRENLWLYFITDSFFYFLELLFMNS